MFIGRNLFVNEKCIMYGNRCSNAGFININYEKSEIHIIDNGYVHIKIPFDEFKQDYNNIKELYRRILFLRFGVSV
jgi:hypothetical protein